MKKTFLLLTCLVFVAACSGGGGGRMMGNGNGEPSTTATGCDSIRDTAGAHTTVLNGINESTPSSYCNALAAVVAAEDFVAGVSTADASCQQVTDVNAAITSAKLKMAKMFYYKYPTCRYPVTAALKGNSIVASFYNILIPSASATFNNNNPPVDCHTTFWAEIVANMYNNYYVCGPSGVSSADSKKIFAEVLASYVVKSAYGNGLTKSEEDIKNAALNAVTNNTAETLTVIAH